MRRRGPAGRHAAGCRGQLPVARHARRCVPLHLPTGEPSTLPRAPGDEFARPSASTPPCCCPMVRNGQIVGVSSFARRAPARSPRPRSPWPSPSPTRRVIAIENVRLFNETKEALEQQTATAEVLQVISSSVADTAPVFEKILESGQRLFATEQLGIFLVKDDGQVHAAAWRGSALDAIARTFPKPRRADDDGAGHPRAAHGPRARRCGDARRARPRCAAWSQLHGNCSVAWAPMLWEDRGIGSISVLRQPPRPFSDKELALLKTFADQAVIAIQNARLFNETKEALERQTATAEVLQVISSSVADTQPVFEKILDSCQRLIACSDLAVLTVDEDSMVHLGLTRGPGGRRAAQKFKPTPIARTIIAEAVLERRVMHYPDALSGDGVPEAIRRMAAKIGNFSCSGRADDVAGQWCRRLLRRPHVRGPPVDDVHGAGDRPAGDLRRPGGDRDPERAPVQAGAGGARRGRGRQRGQELVPRHDEPRDPHADERRHRHERAAARHEARRRAARLRRHDPRIGRRAADHHQRHPRLLEDRSRPHGHRVAAVRPARVRRVGARPREHARHGKAPRHRLRVRGRRPGRDQRRRDAAAPDPAQPAVQCGEVHRARRGGAHGEREAARRRTGWN